jgi:hypothetical protein
VKTSRGSTGGNAWGILSTSPSLPAFRSIQALVTMSTITRLLMTCVAGLTTMTRSRR